MDDRFDDNQYFEENDIDELNIGTEEVSPEEEYDYEYYGKAKPVKRRHTFLFVLVLLIMAAVGGTVFGLKFMGADVDFKEYIPFLRENKTEATEEALESEVVSEEEEIVFESDALIEFENDSRSKFVKINDGYVYLTKDGSKFYKDFDGHSWSDTYTMSSVNATVNGKYAFVNEVRGKNIRLYSTEGIMFSGQTDGNVANASLNSSGICAVVEKCEKHYKIRVYRNDGELLLERFEQDDGVYPLSTAISEDGRILAITYADTSDVELETKVLLFYINREDAKNTETGDFFAGIEKADMIAPYIFAIDKGFAVVHDGGVFAIGNDGKEKWNFSINNEIVSVLEADGRIILALGDEIKGRSDYPEGSVIIINGNGEIEGSYIMDGEITYINRGDSSVIIGSGKDFVCTSYSGELKWKYTATQDVKDIFVHSKKEALIITGKEAKIVEFENLKKQ